MSIGSDVWKIGGINFQSLIEKMEKIEIWKMTQMVPFSIWHLHTVK